MRNKKGFTLIELLAIIVILAVIMVIAVPQILNVVNGSKNGAWKNNVNMIERAITKNSKLVDPETGFYKYTIDGLCSNTSKFKEIVKADDTSITCSNNVFTLTGTGQFTGKSATITCTNNKCTVSIKNGDTSLALAPGLYDSSDNLIASWDSLVNDYGMDIWAWFNWNVLETRSTQYFYFGKEKFDIYSKPRIDQYGDTHTEFDAGAYTPSQPGWIYYDSGDDFIAGDIDVSEIPINAPNVIFQKNANLRVGKKLVIPGTVEKIPMDAFMDCDNLEELVIQPGVKYIMNSGFAYNFSLRRIELPEGLLRIGNEAFAGNTSLQYINIPTTVDYIGVYAINGNGLYSDEFSSKTITVDFKDSEGWKVGYVDEGKLRDDTSDPYDMTLLSGTIEFESGPYNELTGEVDAIPKSMSSSILSNANSAGELFMNQVYQDASWAKIK